LGGFQRIRHYGFLANCHRAQKLALCRRLLATPCSELLPQPAACRDFQAALIASRPRLCPRCGVGILISIQTLWPCGTVKNPSTAFFSGVSIETAQ